MATTKKRIVLGIYTLAVIICNIIWHTKKLTVLGTMSQSLSLDFFVGMVLSLTSWLWVIWSVFLTISLCKRYRRAGYPCLKLVLLLWVVSALVLLGTSFLLIRQLPDSVNVFSIAFTLAGIASWIVYEAGIFRLLRRTKPQLPTK